MAVEVEGVRYSFGILVAETSQEAMERLVRVDPDHWTREGETAPHGAYWADSYWIEKNRRAPKPGPGGMILLNAELEGLKVNTIAHEATHAAMHTWLIHLGKPFARFGNHVNGSNELIAYLVGDLTGAIIERLFAAGYNVKG